MPRQKKEVKAHLRLVKQAAGDWVLTLKDRQVVTNQCVKRFLGEEAAEANALTLGCTIEEKIVYKTLPQLGYLHAEIIPKALIGFLDLGWNGLNIHAAYHELKRRFLCDVYTNRETGETIEAIKSMADCTKFEASNFMDECIIFIQTELNVDVQTPAEYYAKLGAKVPFKSTEEYAKEQQEKGAKKLSN